MLLWSTHEVAYVRLPDGFVQTSSIMPQKRNPVALEHGRALASKAWAETQAFAQIVHNTPFGDVVDSEDDVQPLVAQAFRDATRAVTLAAVTMAGAEFDVSRMRAGAAADWVTVTELADTLVRDHGLSFKAAHAIGAEVARSCRVDDRARQVEVIAAAARALGHEVHLSEEALSRTLSPETFVAVRRTAGGPAPDLTAGALDQAREALTSDRTRLAEARASLEHAGLLRRQALEAI
jgi:argininosuccinate lyase